MTLQAWSILVNAVVAALLLVGGFWLRSVVTQQLRSKDTAIQALEAAIKSKEAEISVLKSDSAPAIARAYAVMKQHANEMTEESKQASEQLRQLLPFTAALSERVRNLTAAQQLGREAAAAGRLLGETKGLITASSLLEKHLGNELFSDELPEISIYKFQAIVEAFMLTFSELTAKVKKKSEKAKEIMDKLDKN